MGIGNPTTPYSNIIIHSNYFINNTNQIDGCHCPASLTETNPWGINVDGNYWSDYTGTAKNGGEVGAVPYLVNGTIPDNNPLMNIPSGQPPKTLLNLNIELTLAVSLPIIFIIGFIALTKRKKQASKPIEKAQ